MTVLDILTTIIHNTIVYSTPLIFAALGGAFSERSGVVNIGLEGLMISGGFAAAVTTIFFGEALGLGPLAPYLGLAIAILFGVLFALPHAVASISFRADQVVSGVAINFLAIGFAVFMLKKLFNGAAQTTTIQNPFKKIAIPFLSDIPYLGKMFFIAYPTSYLAVILAFVTYYIFFKTPFGLRLRAVGEHPKAADTLGVNVIKMRYTAVLLSGAFAAAGGATIALAITNNFTHSTVSGQGFMSLAALIFGKWHPIGALGASLFFGMAQALAAVGQVLGLTKYIPADFLTMLPYILTILALAGLVGKANAPAAVGKPYEKGQR
ncbi:ABC transporter permease [Ammoniphilus sp. YIM 78166]|uniref:ABC transporter permease n=1 Tax=Ammoniphilus sp. YIM 78166 TaxID=1644106 RepID=UPI00107031B0|nr:ABC transporter permease [Ammoniphilus sp. YIM 78166]